MSDRRTILILSANPKGTNPLRLSEEIREIKEGLRRSKYRDLYQVETAEAVRVGDIQRAMLDYEPNIVLLFTFVGMVRGKKVYFLRM